MTAAERIRAKLLDLAIRGKLVPQNESDEPADVLLKRILAAKKSHAETQRRGGGRAASLLPESVIDAPFDLPKGWVWCKISDVFVVQRGGSPRPIKDYLTDSSDGINWIKIADASAGGKYITTVREKIKPHGLKKTRKVYAGDLLLTNSMSFGHPYILQVDGCIHDGWLVLHALEENINKEFFYYLLSSPFVYASFSITAAGGVVQNLNADKVSDTYVPLPPLAEQQRIAAKMEELLKAVDTLGECVEKFDKLSDKARAKILDLAIRGKLVPQDVNDEPADALLSKIREEKTRLLKAKKIKKEKPLPPITDEEKPFDLPRGWAWCRLGEISSKVGAGSTPRGGKSVYVEHGIKFIREQNVYNDGLCEEGMVFIDERTNHKMAGTVVRPCDLLMNITGASIGRTALVPDDFDIGNVNQHVLIVRLVEPCVRYYIHLVLSSPFIISLMLRSQTGDKPGLSAEKVSGFLIPLPPLAEQKRIVAKVEAILAACEKLKGAGA